jgi:hypothetical protein
MPNPNAMCVECFLDFSGATTMWSGTSKRYNWALAILAGLALVCPAVAATQGDNTSGSPIVGRWDISISQKNRQASSWIAIKPDKDGKLEAQFLGTGSGIHPIDPPTFKDNTLTFRVGACEYTGKLVGDTLSGMCMKGNAGAPWVAQRYVPQINVAGKWSLTSGEKKLALDLKQDGSKVSGKWTEDGKKTEISDGKVIGNTLAFVTGHETLTLQVKGDRIVGQRNSGEITGTRQCKWGKPIVLLDGKPEDLENWQPLYSKDFSWKIVDGVMSNGGNGTENIVTKRTDFRNFKLRVEFKVPPGGNSGVYLRGRHEIQVADSFGRQPDDGSCGALYSRIVPKTNACKKAGEWQTYDIVLIDNYLTVVQNDQTVIDNQEIEGITGGAIDSKENEPGPIYLQGDHTQVWYRKMVLTPLE